MKLIKKIYKNVTESDHVRCVLINKNNKIALVYNQKFDIYKIPGGTVEDGEQFLDTLKREIYEETGIINYTIIDEIGKAELIKIDSFYNDGIYKQNNYCYLAKTDEIKCTPHFTEHEISNSFSVEFIDINTALENINIKLSNIEKYDEPHKSQFERDMFLLKTGITKYLEL